MVKGIQRQMVMVRTAESELFEMAYFVLRADAPTKSNDKGIVSEANSIARAVCEESSRSRRKKRSRGGGRILSFFIGVLFGALVLAAFIVLARFL